MSYGVMTKGVMKHLIDRIFEAVDEDGTVVFAFQGFRIIESLSYMSIVRKRTGQSVTFFRQTEHY